MRCSDLRASVRFWRELVALLDWRMEAKLMPGAENISDVGQDAHKEYALSGRNIRYADRTFSQVSRRLCSPGKWNYETRASRTASLAFSPLFRS